MTKLEVIVIGTDFSPCAEKAIQAVQNWAPGWQTQKVHLVSVVEPVTWASASVVAAGAELATLAIEAATRRLDEISLDIPGVKVSREVRLGNPARELAVVGREQNADLLVTATHGRTGLERVALGSVSSDLVRLSHAPVLVVPSRQEVFEVPSKILAAVDLSPISGEVLRYGGLFAEGGEGQVKVLSSFDYPLASVQADELLPHFPNREEIQSMENEYQQKVIELVQRKGAAVSMDVEVISKTPASQVILDVASLIKADLVVIGTSGRNAWHRMILGSTASRVLNESPCPVLVIPHEINDKSQ